MKIIAIKHTMPKQASRKALKKHKNITLRFRKYVPYSDLKNRHVHKKKVYFDVKAIQVQPHQKLIDVRNFAMQSVTGEELEFLKVNNEYDALTICSYAEIERQPVSGEYVLPTGEILVFVRGHLKKIIASQPVTALNQKTRHAYSV